MAHGNQDERLWEWMKRWPQAGDNLISNSLNWFLKDTYGDQSVKFACRYRSLKDWNTFYTYMYVIFIESRYPIVCYLLSVSIMITNLELLFCYLGKYPGDRRRIWRNKNFRHWKGAVCSDIARTCKQVNNQTPCESLSNCLPLERGTGGVNVNV